MQRFCVCTTISSSSWFTARPFHDVLAVECSVQGNQPLSGGSFQEHDHDSSLNSVPLSAGWSDPGHLWWMTSQLPSQKHSEEPSTDWMGGCHGQFSLVQSLSHVRLFATPWTAARQAYLSITNSLSLPKLMSIESVMPSNHLILCRPLLLLPSIVPNIRAFSNKSALCIRWPKYWSFGFNIRASNEHSGLISFKMAWLDLLAGQGTLVKRISCFLSHWIISRHPILSFLILYPNKEACGHWTASACG